MRTLPKDALTALRTMILITAVCGILYPLVMEGFSQLVFHSNANGQLIKIDGATRGSKLIGQSFAGDPRYFQTRPSGTEDGTDNDAFTSFANYGPNSTITLRALKSNIAAYIKLNGRYVPGGLRAAQVPVDAADTSASGVDPDISVANADIQAHRIAAVNHLPLAAVTALITHDTGGLGLGFAGNVDVNAMELNTTIHRLSKVN